MGRKNLPGYLRHKATGQALCVIDGRFFYLGKYRSKASREEYERIIAEYLNNGKRLPPLRSRGEITCEDLAVRFMDWAESYYLDEDGSPTLTVEHCRMAMIPLVRHYGGNVVSDFGPLSLKFLREKMIEDGYTVKRRIGGELIEQQEEYTRETINAKINVIRQAFRWGVENEIVPPDVSHALDAVAKLKKGRTAAKDNDDISPVPNESVDATLSFLPPIIADMVKVQRFIGGRPQDICNMRAGDIERFGDVWSFRPYRHKTKHKGKDRNLAVGPRAREILLPYLMRKLPEEFIFSPVDSVKQFREDQREKRKTKVQPSQVNRSKPKTKRKPREQYDHYSYRRAIHRACDKAGIERWNPNQLRHSAGTETAANFSIEAAKEFLGHASIKTTEKYYVAPLPELAAKVAREIG